MVYAIQNNLAAVEFFAVPDAAESVVAQKVTVSGIATYAITIHTRTVDQIIAKP
jgi:hypothetical protein